MDNKRVYRKIATIFWFLLAIGPFLFVLFGTCFQFFSPILNNSTIDFNNGVSSYFDTFGEFLNNASEQVGIFFPEWFLDLLENLGDTLDLPYEFVYMLGWFILVYIIELLVDIIVWLPKFIHRLLEKYGGVE